VYRDCLDLDGDLFQKCTVGEHRSCRLTNQNQIGPASIAASKPKQPLELKHPNCLTFRGLHQERGWLFRMVGEERYVPIRSGFLCNDSAAVISVARDTVRA